MLWFNSMSCYNNGRTMISGREKCIFTFAINRNAPWVFARNNVFCFSCAALPVNIHTLYFCFISSPVSYRCIVQKKKNRRVYKAFNLSCFFLEFGTKCLPMHTILCTYLFFFWFQVNAHLYWLPKMTDR